MRRQLTLWCLLVLAVPATAQDLVNPFGDLGGDFQEPQKPEVTSSLHPAGARPGDPVTLAIEVVIPEEYYTYSLGKTPNSTRIQITGTTGLEPLDKAPTPDHPPKVVIDKLVGKYKKFVGRVVWRQKFRMAAATGPVTVTGGITLNICNQNGCLPPELFPIKLALGDGPELPAPATDQHPFTSQVTPTSRASGRETATPVSWHFELAPADAAVGDTVTLTLKATLEKEFHIFALSQDRKNSGRPIRIKVEGLRGLEPLGDGFKEDRPFETKVTTIGTRKIEQRFFHGTVAWSRSYRVTDSVTKNGFGARGNLLYQYCNASGCLMGKVSFALGRVAASDTVSGKSITQQVAPVETLDLDSLQVQGRNQDQSLGLVLVIAFAAGLILNFMPCVLPVIGLKIMSFVEQSGESRRQTFLLNVWFSLGLISVYLVLATLATTIGLGWGAQFGSLAFNIVLVAVVFAFALSFLDVWEIPIPGFSTTPGPDGTQQEGAVGAFSKGVLTTVLATPCSGPMLVPALTYAASQPPLITYLGFFMVGLGMAFPYLMIGAFPRLIGFLPKPGMWMQTFKHVMGFVLLGTVVWLLTIVATVSLPAIVPLVGFLFALWAACWWYGRIPLTQGRRARLRALVEGSVFVTAIGWLMFSESALGGVMNARFEQLLDRQVSIRNEELASQATQATGTGTELSWQRFTPERLAELTAQQKTVFIDFTADW